MLSRPVRIFHVATTEMEIDDDNLTAEFGCLPAFATWIRGKPRIQQFSQAVLGKIATGNGLYTREKLNCGMDRYVISLFLPVQLAFAVMIIRQNLQVQEIYEA